MLEECNLSFDFTQGYSLEIESQKRLGTFKQCLDCDKTMGTFEVQLNVLCIMIWLQAYRSQELECDGLNETAPSLAHRFACLVTTG